MKKAHLHTKVALAYSSLNFYEYSRFQDFLLILQEFVLALALSLLYLYLNFA